MAVLEVLRDGALNSLGVLLRISLIVFPVMVALRLVKDFGGLEWLEKRLRKVMRRIGLPAEATPAVAAGLIFGFVLGAAFLIDLRKEQGIKRDQLVAICCSLGIVHALLEETAVMISFGADPWVVVSVRFLVAFATYLFIMGVPFVRRGIGHRLAKTECGNRGPA